MRLLSGCVGDNRQLKILHFNDVYELESAEREPVGGAARFSTLIKMLEEDPSYARAMLICSGDFVGPSMISNVTKGRHMVDILNILGVDFGCIGNHEFDFGVKNLEQRLDDSQAIWLLSNISRPGTNESVSGTCKHLLTRWNGVRVGRSYSRFKEQYFDQLSIHPHRQVS